MSAKKDDMPGREEANNQGFHRINEQETSNKERFVNQNSYSSEKQKRNEKHLIYAYLIENTRIYEIFRRVIYEFFHGENLGIPKAHTRAWLRQTEDSFYKDTQLLASTIRPDIVASRRNAYYRMFGMDLVHGTDDNRPYPFEKTKVANREFVSTFEEFLREVWIGIINRDNHSGANPTDDYGIAKRAKSLQEMLQARRLDNNLWEEEAVFVQTMSWFHTIIQSDNEVITDLDAEAFTPWERLRKIGTKVKLPANAQTENYIELADDMSDLLTFIEYDFNHQIGGDVESFYKGSRSNQMKRIVTHWSAATGRDLKATKVMPASK